jgi:isopentenyl-diphosphate delta-isomerase type 1
MLSKVRTDLTSLAGLAAMCIVLLIAAFFTAKVDIRAYFISSLITSLSVAAFAVPSFFALRRWLGKRHAVYVFVGFGLLALTIETFALLTGYPYGRFAYSDLAGYRLFGVVPWTVAFAWTPLVLAAYACAAKFLDSPLLRVLGAASLLVVIDLVLDPGAVAVGLWRYDSPVGFYEVPFSNFVGWFVTGLIAATALEVYVRKTRPLLPVPLQLASSAFLILFFWTCVAVFKTLTAPALIGAFILSTFGYLFWRYSYAFDEMVVLVDDENRAVATAGKFDVHTSDTPLHLAFSVFLFNSAGELLLQQRSLTKRTWPGVWSNSCCGHVMLHESVDDAARRRLRYELGIRRVRLVNIVPHFRYRAEKDGVVENEICPILIGFTDDKPRPNPNEVSDVVWTSWSNFIQTCDADPEAYSPWAVLEAKELMRSPTFSFYVKSITSDMPEDESPTVKRPVYE